MPSTTTRSQLRLIAHARINKFFEITFVSQLLFFVGLYLFVNAVILLIAIGEPAVVGLPLPERLWWALHSTMPGLEGAIELSATSERQLRGIEINPLFPFVAMLLSWGIGVVWQAFFIAKLFYNRHDIEFSEKIAFYSPANLAREGIAMPYGALVFKLFSKNSAPLFDLKVRAVIKHLARGGSNPTFQHFPLRLMDQNIPLFEPFTPFRFYIDLGTVKSAIYEREVVFHAQHAQPGHESAEKIVLKDLVDQTREGKLQASENEIIIYVEAKDGNDGRVKIDYHRYPVCDIVEAEFASIDPDANGLFTLEQIVENIDKFHAGPVAAQHAA